MIARNYINNAIPHLKLSDSVDKAINWMEEYKIAHLPVVEHHKLLGIISEKVLLDALEGDTPLKKLQQNFLELSVKGTNHIFDAFTLFTEHQLTIIPVADDDDGYEGMISLQDLVHVFTTLSGLKSPGAILILYMKANDYSMAQISRIIENNGAKVLSSYVMPDADPTKLHLCLKLNRQEINAVVAALERFEYQITARFDESEVKETSQENLDQFFKYLDI